MKKLAVLVLVLALTVVCVPAWAEGDITDGDVTFSYTGFDEFGGFADLVNDGVTDHLFAQWWWYRVAGDSAETVLPPPRAENYAGDTAMLAWLNVDGRGFDAIETVVVSDGAGAGEATARHDLEITNVSGGDLTISLFHYTDFDMDQSAGSDSATLLTANNRIAVTEVASADIRALGADAYQVAEWSVVRDLLGDGLVSDLDNTGLPFGPADFTGALQWREVTLPDGASITYSVIATINGKSEALEMSLNGTCPGPVNLTVSGATPNGAVGLLASPTPGAGSVPVGSCAGTELGLSAPNFLRGVAADANGSFSINLNLGAGVCSNLLQALDLETCGVTNVDPLP